MQQHAQDLTGHLSKKTNVKCERVAYPVPVFVIVRENDEDENVVQMGRESKRDAIGRYGKTTMVTCSFWPSRKDSLVQVDSLCAFHGFLNYRVCR
jgi:hypothetical protein